MKGCKRCGYINDPGVLFCHECGLQQEQHSAEEIERLKHSAQCPNCDYYNPIENESCARCDYSLRSKSGVMIRDAQGRVSLVRTVKIGPIGKALAWLTIFLIIISALMMTGATLGDTGNIGKFLMDQRGQMLGFFWILLVLFFAFEWSSGLIYRLKTALVLMLALLATSVHLGEPTLRLLQWKLDKLVLFALLGVLTFGILYIVRRRILGSIISTLIAFLGLYCAVAPIVTFFNGGGFLASITCVPNFAGPIPSYVGPTFLTYHLFLPYCFLQMMGATMRAFLRSMERVDGTKSIARFLNRRKEEARGELLNLFIVGIMLHLGFLVMRQLGEPNIVSLLERGWQVIF